MLRAQHLEVAFYLGRLTTRCNTVSSPPCRPRCLPKAAGWIRGVNLWRLSLNHAAGQSAREPKIGHREIASPELCLFRAIARLAEPASRPLGASS